LGKFTGLTQFAKMSRKYGVRALLAPHIFGPLPVNCVTLVYNTYKYSGAGNRNWILTINTELLKFAGFHPAPIKLLYERETPA
ncbi:MAG: hypothetical protein AB8I58_15025, partial [Anaerolineales bacterium]